MRTNLSLGFYGKKKKGGSRRERGIWEEISVGHLILFQ
jgi:hypothetical protein